MRHATPLLLVFFLACAHGRPEVQDVVAVPEGVAPLRPLSEDSCPPFRSSGLQRMRSGGFDRQVLTLLPPVLAAGAPSVVVFHGLAATPEGMVPRLRLDELARQGAIVVVPKAHRSAQLGWGLGPKGAADVALWEDLRSCLVARLGADPARISIAGFSAGGLWATLTMMHGARGVASATIFSGGLLAPFVEYHRPDWPVPVTLLHGGDADRYKKGPWNVVFKPGTLALAEALARDGHAVRLCDHGMGHRLPPAWAGQLHQRVLQARVGLAVPDAGPAPPGCEDR